MEGATFGVRPLVRFSEVAVQLLADAREEIDALNVYPIPDGDTGTNLFLSFEYAHEALLACVAEQGGEDAADLAVTLAGYCRGLLLGARGNSGVIMSQMIGALVRRVGAAAPGERPAVVLAEGLVAATEASYAAVGEPVEGTMLSVARAASEAASALVADPTLRVAQVLAAAARAAHEALARTPEQLDVLRSAGVVDAGGRGLCLVLDAAESAFTGRRRAPDPPRARRRLPVPLPTHDLTAEGPAYEVMYLLDAADDAIAGLRERLAPLGDSLVVVGGEGLWNVHVHVDDVGAAIEAGIQAGRPHRVRVTHFAEQVAVAGERAAEERAAGERDGAERGGAERGGAPQPGRTLVVVALAFGPGLAALFTDAGAVVLENTVDRRPSAAELLEAIRESGAAEVVLVPNDRDAVPTAVAAARIAEQDDGIRVAVIPTHTQVQGLAALAVQDSGRPLDQDLVEMVSAARHARSGAVTVAARRALTTAGYCEPGDVLGVVEGDFVVVGQDMYEVAVDVIARMLGGGGELFTVIAGKGGEELAGRCVQHLHERHPTVDVLSYDGGQDRYPVLFGVE